MSGQSPSGNGGDRTAGKERAVEALRDCSRPWGENLMPMAGLKGPRLGWSYPGISQKLLRHCDLDSSSSPLMWSLPMVGHEGSAGAAVFKVLPLGTRNRTGRRGQQCLPAPQ